MEKAFRERLPQYEIKGQNYEYNVDTSCLWPKPEQFRQSFKPVYRTAKALPTVMLASPMN